MLGASAGPKVDTDGALARFSHREGFVRVGRAGVRRLVELASKQFGVVTRADLGCTEVSWKWLRGRLATGEWNRVHRGVFRLGCNQPGRDEREMAALLAAGQGAVLSHTSAARRLGLDVPPRDESVHLTIPASRKAKVRAAKVWRSRTLTARDVMTGKRFRLTNLARTMVDLASVLDDGWLRAAFDSAVRQDEANVIWISRVLARFGRGRRGVSRLRSLVEEYRRGDEVPDSALESLAVELARATGREPKLHHKVLDGGRHVAEVDLAWPELGLCAQFDGWKHHRTREAFVKDRACDRALFQLGWTVPRYPWDDVVREPDSFIEGLVRSFEVASRLRPQRPKSAREPWRDRRDDRSGRNQRGIGQ
jgi:very-short-patch-repair endonuclease